MRQNRLVWECGRERVGEGESRKYYKLWPCGGGIGGAYRWWWWPERRRRRAGGGMQAAARHARFGFGSGSDVPRQHLRLLRLRVYGVSNVTP